MDLLVLGKTNKTIAYELGISQKTVDFHRANILDKAGVDSAYELGISQKTVDFHRANILDKAGVDSVVELLRLTQKAKLP